MTELPVWVGGREKIVGGLNRHTRCEDVIAILLQDRYRLSKCELPPQNLQCYALFEKWRGCERQLSPRTRMYKLWKAWGAERDHVKFTLRKSVAMSKRRNSLDSEVDSESGGIKLRDKTKQPSSQGQYNLEKGIVAFDLKKKTTDGGRKDSGGKKEKRRRSWADESDVGFSDVRILCPPPLDCDSSASTSSSSGKVTADGPTTLAEEVEGKSKLPSSEHDSESLIQRILKQSHQLHSLLETMGDVDVEIEHYETRLHHLRMQKDGRNYVQEAYLPGVGRDGDVAERSREKDDMDPLAYAMEDLNLGDQCSDWDGARVPMVPLQTVHELEEYVALCDRLFNADEQLRRRQEAIASLSEEIANQRISPECAPSTSGKSTSRPKRYERKRVVSFAKQTHKREASDVGFARAQLETSANICVAQRKELDTLHEQIHETECVYRDKHVRLRALTSEVALLESEEDALLADQDDDEISDCVEMSHSTPVSIRSKNSSMESSLDQGIGHEFSPIDMTNRKSPSRSCDTDSSSDTGLSSLHSQDDSEQMVYNIAETLV